MPIIPWGRASRLSPTINKPSPSTRIFDRPSEGNRLANLGLAYRNLGQLADARQAWQQALQIYEEIKSPSADRVRQLLALLDSQPPQG